MACPGCDRIVDMGDDRVGDLGRGSVSAKCTVDSEDLWLILDADEVGGFGSGCGIGLDLAGASDDVLDALLVDERVDAEVLLLPLESRFE